MQNANTNYYRVMAGPKSIYANEFLNGGFIAANWDINQDLTQHLPDDWRQFNHEFIPVVLANNPEKTKIGAGLCCGMLHTLCKYVKQGDVILTPNGNGQYMVGEVISDYYYVPSGNLSHRRKVHWFDLTIPRDIMSSELKGTTGTGNTITQITKHIEELKVLIGGQYVPTLIHTDETVEDATSFALEKHLEDFLIANWANTELGKNYEVYTDEGEIVGQQYQTDTGPIDILAISKDKQTLLVVELKRGRASDVVVGQIQRYMGYVKDELAEAGQQVKGVIIALEDDLKLRRALSVTHNIDFYRYQLSFKLIQGNV